MKGNPKFDYGDVVKFNINDEEKCGVVAIIDRYGTFFDDSDACYDILNEDENILYKHINEKFIIEKIKKTKSPFNLFK